MTYRRQTALSLLEVLLALAILGGTMAVIGELMRIGARNAEIARDSTTAQMLCETKMAELEIGFQPLQAVDATPVEDLEFQEDWLYSLLIEQVDGQGLVSVRVLVEQNPLIYSRPVTFELTRWMIDETLLPIETVTTGGASG